MDSSFFSLPSMGPVFSSSAHQHASNDFLLNNNTQILAVSADFLNDPIVPMDVNASTVSPFDSLTGFGHGDDMLSESSSSGMLNPFASSSDESVANTSTFGRDRCPSFRSALTPEVSSPTDHMRPLADNPFSFAPGFASSAPLQSSFPSTTTAGPATTTTTTTRNSSLSSSSPLPVSSASKPAQSHTSSSHKSRSSSSSSKAHSRSSKARSRSSSSRGNHLTNSVKPHSSAKTIPVPTTTTTTTTTTTSQHLDGNFAQKSPVPVSSFGSIPMDEHESTMMLPPETGDLDITLLHKCRGNDHHVAWNVIEEGDSIRVSPRGKLLALRVVSNQVFFPDSLKVLLYDATPSSVADRKRRRARKSKKHLKHSMDTNPSSPSTSPSLLQSSSDIRHAPGLPLAVMQFTSADETSPEPLYNCQAEFKIKRDAEMVRVVVQMRSLSGSMLSASSARFQLHDSGKRRKRGLAASEGRVVNDFKLTRGNTFMLSSSPNSPQSSPRFSTSTSASRTQPTPKARNDERAQKPRKLPKHEEVATATNEDSAVDPRLSSSSSSSSSPYVPPNATTTTTTSTTSQSTWTESFSQTAQHNLYAEHAQPQPAARSVSAKCSDAAWPGFSRQATFTPLTKTPGSHRLGVPSSADPISSIFGLDGHSSATITTSVTSAPRYADVPTTTSVTSAPLYADVPPSTATTTSTTTSSSSSVAFGGSVARSLGETDLMYGEGASLLEVVKPLSPKDSDMPMASLAVAGTESRFLEAPVPSGSFSEDAPGGSLEPLFLSAPLHIHSTVHAHRFIQYSDQRLKKDIQEIADAVELIQQLEGKRYRWRDDSIGKAHGGQKVLGLIAQQVREVLPEAVHETEDGYLTVAYVEIIPVLIEAFKQHVARYSADQKSVNEELSFLRAAVRRLDREQTHLRLSNESVSDDDAAREDAGALLTDDEDAAQTDEEVSDDNEDDDVEEDDEQQSDGDEQAVPAERCTKQRAALRDAVGLEEITEEQRRAALGLLACYGPVLRAEYAAALIQAAWRGHCTRRQLRNVDIPAQIRYNTAVRHLTIRVQALLMHLRIVRRVQMPSLAQELGAREFALVSAPLEPLYDVFERFMQNLCWMWRQFPVMRGLGSLLTELMPELNSAYAIYFATVGRAIHILDTARLCNRAPASQDPCQSEWSSRLRLPRDLLWDVYYDLRQLMANCHCLGAQASADLEALSRFTPFVGWLAQEPDKESRVRPHCHSASAAALAATSSCQQSCTDADSPQQPPSPPPPQPPTGGALSAIAALDIANLPFRVDAPHRRLLLRCRVLLDQRQKRTLLLFNDLLMVCKPRPRPSSSGGGGDASQRFDYRYHAPLSSVALERLPPSHKHLDCGFVLSTPGHSAVVTVSATESESAQQARDRLFNAVRTAICQRQQQLDHSLSRAIPAIADRLTDNLTVELALALVEVHSGLRSCASGRLRSFLAASSDGASLADRMCHSSSTLEAAALLRAMIEELPTTFPVPLETLDGLGIGSDKQVPASDLRGLPARLEPMHVPLVRSYCTLLARCFELLLHAGLPVEQRVPTAQMVARSMAPALVGRRFVGRDFASPSDDFELASLTVRSLITQASSVFSVADHKSSAPVLSKEYPAVRYAKRISGLFPRSLLERIQRKSSKTPSPVVSPRGSSPRSVGASPVPTRPPCLAEEEAQARSPLPERCFSTSAGDPVRSAAEGTTSTSLHDRLHLALTASLSSAAESSDAHSDIAPAMSPLGKSRVRHPLPLLDLSTVLRSHDDAQQPQGAHTAPARVGKATHFCSPSPERRTTAQQLKDALSRRRQRSRTSNAAKCELADRRGCSSARQKNIAVADKASSTLASSPVSVDDSRRSPCSSEPVSASEAEEGPCDQAARSVARDPVEQASDSSSQSDLSELSDSSSLSSEEEEHPQQQQQQQQDLPSASPSFSDPNATVRLPSPTSGEQQEEHDEQSRPTASPSSSDDEEHLGEQPENLVRDEALAPLAPERQQQHHPRSSSIAATSVLPQHRTVVSPPSRAPSQSCQLRRDPMSPPENSLHRTHILVSLLLVMLAFAAGRYVA
eukprot:CAMPEP_0177665290 /NCGR_PEP_ID=MMETSP0447-20121125/20973_1 /TAXON_ID=0 /ORGANISM="Stygamoeba regulata, Strain BSH-02190019" /LENGTH=2057 /DNA_ID=CAMNT_0019171369 /DNA_START=212 /DNA_END=6386 /DNA_ORIENTATION=+